MTWSLFEDWCYAVECSALPATPHTLARFVSAHPAATATQRRRITVIDAAHYRSALVPPGRSETVRAAVDVARTARLQEFAAQVRRIVAELPQTGWPASVFARRDALVLVLAAAGIPCTQIASLRICDVTTDSDVDGLRIATGDGNSIDTAQMQKASEIDTQRVLRRWREVLGYLDRYPNTAMLAEALAGDDKADLRQQHRQPNEDGSLSENALSGYDRSLGADDTRPLLTPMDRWGHMPWSPTALSARAVADIVRTHLHGGAPTHSAIARSNTVRGDVATPDVDRTGVLAPEVWLDPDYHVRGIRARRAAHDAFAGVESLLGDVEDRADDLLRALLHLVEDATGEVEPHDWE